MMPSFCNGNRPFFIVITLITKGAFQKAVDSYCCVTDWTWLKINHYGYITFSDDEWGGCAVPFNVVCMGSSHNNYFQKKV